MPGGARMYPETDILPIRLDNLDTQLEMPKLIEDKAEMFHKKLGLGQDLAKAIAKSARCSLFEKIVNKYKQLKPAFVAETLVSFKREVRKSRPSADPDKVNDKDLEAVFDALAQGRISKMR